MSYSGLVDTQLRKAFSLAKDLAQVAVFSKKNVTGFNFGTGSVVSAGDGSVTTKVIVTQTKKSRTAVTKTLMVESSDVGELNNYTTVTLDGDLYDVGETLKNTGFIYLLTVSKELKDG